MKDSLSLSLKILNAWNLWFSHMLPVNLGQNREKPIEWRGRCRGERSTPAPKLSSTSLTLCSYGSQCQLMTTVSTASVKIRATSTYWDGMMSKSSSNTDEFKVKYWVQYIDKLHQYIGHEFKLTNVYLWCMFLSLCQFAELFVIVFVELVYTTYL